MSSKWDFIGQLLSMLPQVCGEKMRHYLIRPSSDHCQSASGVKVKRRRQRAALSRGGVVLSRTASVIMQGRCTALEKKYVVEVVRGGLGAASSVLLKRWTGCADLVPHRQLFHPAGSTCFRVRVAQEVEEEVKGTDECK